jgi:hypothetical protein
LEALVKMPLLPPPSTATTVNDTAISTVSSIPLLPPSTTTIIVTVNDRHCRCIIN